MSQVMPLGHHYLIVHGARRSVIMLALIQPSLIIPSDGKRGTITTQIAAEFGLSNNVVVAGGAGDNAAAAIGIGAVRKGQGLVSLGTSGVVLAVNDSWTPQAETVQPCTKRPFHSNGCDTNGDRLLVLAW